MQASMSEFALSLEGRDDDGVHQSNENGEIMEPNSPSGRDDSRALSNNQFINEVLAQFSLEVLGITENEQSPSPPTPCVPDDPVPIIDTDAFKFNESKTYVIDGSNETYGTNWDEGLLENDYGSNLDYFSSYAQEVVITTETQPPPIVDKTPADTMVSNPDYSLEVLAPEKYAQGFPVEETLQMTSTPAISKTEIDTLQEESAFFEDIDFIRNTTDLKDCKSYYEAAANVMNGERSPEDASPACPNLHIVPMSDGGDQVSNSPPEEFAVPVDRLEGIVEVGPATSPDVAKVPTSSSSYVPKPRELASTSQRGLDLPSCCGPFGAVVMNQIVLPYSGEGILSENDSLDSMDYGPPKLVRNDDPPPPVNDETYEDPPKLDPVDQTFCATTTKGVKITTSTLASAAGEDLLKSSKKIMLDVVPETSQEGTAHEGTNQDELNDSLGKIVPSITADISNQISAGIMSDIYDVPSISLESNLICSSVGSSGSLALLPVTEEPRTFKRISPTKRKNQMPVSSPLKSRPAISIRRDFVDELLRSEASNKSVLSFDRKNNVQVPSKGISSKPPGSKELVFDTSSGKTLQNLKAIPSSCDLDQPNSALLDKQACIGNISVSSSKIEPEYLINMSGTSDVKIGNLKVDVKTSERTTKQKLPVIRSIDTSPIMFTDDNVVKTIIIKKISTSDNRHVPIVEQRSDKLSSKVSVSKVQSSSMEKTKADGISMTTSLPKKSGVVANQTVQKRTNVLKVPELRPVNIDMGSPLLKVEPPNGSEGIKVSFSTKAALKASASLKALKVSLPISSLNLLSVKQSISSVTKTVEGIQNPKVNHPLLIATKAAIEPSVLDSCGGIASKSPDDKKIPYSVSPSLPSSKVVSPNEVDSLHLEGLEIDSKSTKGAKLSLSNNSDKSTSSTAQTKVNVFRETSARSLSIHKYSPTCVPVTDEIIDQKKHVQKTQVSSVPSSKPCDGVTKELVISSEESRFPKESDTKMPKPKICYGEKKLLVAPTDVSGHLNEFDTEGKNAREVVSTAITNSKVDIERKKSLVTAADVTRNVLEVVTKKKDLQEAIATAVPNSDLCKKSNKSLINAADVTSKVIEVVTKIKDVQEAIATSMPNSDLSKKNEKSVMNATDVTSNVMDAVTKKKDLQETIATAMPNSDICKKSKKLISAPDVSSKVIEVVTKIKDVQEAIATSTPNSDLSKKNNMSMINATDVTSNVIERVTKIKDVQETKATAMPNSDLRKISKKSLINAADVTSNVIEGVTKIKDVQEASSMPNSDLNQKNKKSLIIAADVSCHPSEVDCRQKTVMESPPTVLPNSKLSNEDKDSLVICTDGTCHLNDLDKKKIDAQESLAAVMTKSKIYDGKKESLPIAIDISDRVDESVTQKKSVEEHFGTMLLKSESSDGDKKTPSGISGHRNEFDTKSDIHNKVNDPGKLLEANPLQDSKNSSILGVFESSDKVGFEKTLDEHPADRNTIDVNSKLSSGNEKNERRSDDTIAPKTVSIESSVQHKDSIQIKELPLTLKGKTITAKESCIEKSKMQKVDVLSWLVDSSQSGLPGTILETVSSQAGVKEITPEDPTGPIVDPSKRQEMNVPAENLLKDVRKKESIVPKKLKGDDVLIAVVNGRTAKLVKKARQLASQSSPSKNNANNIHDERGNKRKTRPTTGLKGATQNAPSSIIVANQSKAAADVDGKAETFEPVQESSKRRPRTRSETMIDKKSLVDGCDKSQGVDEPPLVTIDSPSPSVRSTDKASVNDVYDFTDDDDQSSKFHTIDQFRNLSGKAAKSKKSPQPVNETAQLDVTTHAVDENKRSCGRITRRETLKSSSCKYIKRSSNKSPLKKDIVDTENKNVGDDACKRSSRSQDKLITSLKNDVKSADTHVNSKDAVSQVSTRSRSKEMLTDGDNVSPTRVLRNKVKNQTSNHPLTVVSNQNLHTDPDNHPKEDEGAPLERKSVQKLKSKHSSKVDVSHGKCVDTTEDVAIPKHEYSMSAHECQKSSTEDVGDLRSRMKTRSSIMKHNQKMDEIIANEASPSVEASMLLPKLRSSVTKKTPVSSRNDVTSPKQGCISKNNKSLCQKGVFQEESNPNDSSSLKSGKIYDNVKTVKKLRKPLQVGKDECTLKPNKVDKPSSDVGDKENSKLPHKGILIDIVTDALLTPSILLPSQDNPSFTAEALKTPPMNSVVSQEVENIQTVSDMSEHGEPEGAKSSTRTAQLHSLILLPDVNHREKDKKLAAVEKKRLARERSSSESKQNRNNVSSQSNDGSQLISINPVPLASLVKTMNNVDDSVDIQGLNKENENALKNLKASLSDLAKEQNTDDRDADTEENATRRVTRSSITNIPQGPDAVPQNSSKTPNSDNIIPITRKASGLSQNAQLTELSGSKNKKAPLKDAPKQLEKRLHDKHDTIKQREERVSINPKTRKLQCVRKPTTDHAELPPISTVDPPITSSKSQESKDVDTSGTSGILIARVEGIGVVQPDNNILCAKEVESDEALRGDKYSKAIKDDPKNQSSCLNQNLNFVTPAMKKFVPSTPIVYDTSPLKQLDPLEEGLSLKVKPSANGPSSRRKSKVTPPIKIAPDVDNTSLADLKPKLSIREVCLTSKELDKELDKEEIRVGFDLIDQSPGKSPDSTTQSRTELDTSKLALESHGLCNQKISEDTQGVTSTTESENVSSTLVTDTISSKRSTKNQDCGKPKKEDESVTSTTLDSKLSVSYSSNEIIDRKNEYSSEGKMRYKSMSSTLTSDEGCLIPKDDNAHEVVTEKFSTLSESSRIKLNTLSNKNPTYQSSDNGNTKSEYDVLPPRRKIWRVNRDLNKCLPSDECTAKVVPCSPEIEVSNVIKSVSDEDMKRTPLKKRQVRGLEFKECKSLDVKLSDELKSSDENMSDKDEGLQSPTSSVNQLRHSIYNILAAGPAEKSVLDFEKTDSRAEPKGDITRQSTLTRRNTKFPRRKRKPLISVIVKGSKKSTKSMQAKHSSRLFKRRFSLFSQGNRKSNLLRAKKIKIPKKCLETKQSVSTVTDEPSCTVSNVLPSPTKCDGNGEPLKPAVHKESDVQQPKNSCETDSLKSTQLNQPVVPCYTISEPRKTSLRKNTSPLQYVDTHQQKLKPTEPRNHCAPDRCDNKPTTSSSQVVAHNYTSELAIDVTNDMIEEKSPQFSPLPSRDPSNPNYCGVISPVAADWIKPNCSGAGLVLPSTSRRDLISPSNLFTVPDHAIQRPVLERSRSFSSIDAPARPRARRETYPTPATAVDLSYSRKKALLGGGLISSPIECPSNMAKIDLRNTNPQFFTSFTREAVTYDLAKNQVICHKPDTQSMMSGPFDVTSTHAPPPIRPIPTHKFRPPAETTHLRMPYGPLSGRATLDSFVPTNEPTFSEYSRGSKSLPSAFHCTKGDQSDSRIRYKRQEECNPLLQGGHFMLTTGDIANMSSIPSTSATSLMPSISSPRQNKSIRSTREKSDVSSSTSYAKNATTLGPRDISVPSGNKGTKPYNNVSLKSSFIRQVPRSRSSCYSDHDYNFSGNNERSQYHSNPKIANKKRHVSVNREAVPSLNNATPTGGRTDSVGQIISVLHEGQDTVILTIPDQTSSKMHKRCSNLASSSTKNPHLMSTPELSITPVDPLKAPNQSRRSRISVQEEICGKSGPTNQSIKNGDKPYSLEQSSFKQRVHQAESEKHLQGKVYAEGKYNTSITKNDTALIQSSDLERSTVDSFHTVVIARSELKNGSSNKEAKKELTDCEVVPSKEQNNDERFPVNALAPKPDTNGEDSLRSIGISQVDTGLSIPPRSTCNDQLSNKDEIPITEDCPSSDESSLSKDVNLSSISMSDISEPKIGLDVSNASQDEKEIDHSPELTFSKVEEDGAPVDRGNTSIETANKHPEPVEIPAPLLSTSSNTSGVEVTVSVDAGSLEKCSDEVVVSRSVETRKHPVSSASAPNSTLKSPETSTVSSSPTGKEQTSCGNYIEPLMTLSTGPAAEKTLAAGNSCCRELSTIILGESTQVVEEIPPSSEEISTVVLNATTPVAKETHTDSISSSEAVHTMNLDESAQVAEETPACKETICETVSTPSLDAVHAPIARETPAFEESSSEAVSTPSIVEAVQATAETPAQKKSSRGNVSMPSLDVICKTPESKKLPCENVLALSLEKNVLVPEKTHVPNKSSLEKVSSPSPEKLAQIPFEMHAPGKSSSEKVFSPGLEKSAPVPNETHPPDKSSREKRSAVSLEKSVPIVDETRVPTKTSSEDVSLPSLEKSDPVPNETRPLGKSSREKRSVVSLEQSVPFLDETQVPTKSSSEQVSLPSLEKSAPVPDETQLPTKSSEEEVSLPSLEKSAPVPVETHVPNKSSSEQMSTPSPEKLALVPYETHALGKSSEEVPSASLENPSPVPDNTHVPIKSSSEKVSSPSLEKSFPVHDEAHASDQSSSENVSSPSLGKSAPVPDGTRTSENSSCEKVSAFCLAKYAPVAKEIHATETCRGDVSTPSLDESGSQSEASHPVSSHIPSLEEHIEDTHRTLSVLDAIPVVHSSKSSETPSSNVDSSLQGRSPDPIEDDFNNSSTNSVTIVDSEHLETEAHIPPNSHIEVSHKNSVLSLLNSQELVRANTSAEPSSSTPPDSSENLDTISNSGYFKPSNPCLEVPQEDAGILSVCLLPELNSKVSISDDSPAEEPKSSIEEAIPDDTDSILSVGIETSNLPAESITTTLTQQNSFECVDSNVGASNPPKSIPPLSESHGVHHESASSTNSLVTSSDPVVGTEVIECNALSKLSVPSASPKVCVSDIHLNKSFETESNLEFQNAYRNSNCENDNPIAASTLGSRHDRKRKCPPASFPEDECEELVKLPNINYSRDVVPLVESSISADRLKKKCQLLKSRVRIRPLSPISLEKQMDSGLKVSLPDKEQIFMCWAKFNGLPQVPSSVTVRRAETEDSDNEIDSIRSERTEGEQNRRINNEIPQPSTSWDSRFDVTQSPGLPVWGSGCKEPAYLLQRGEMIHKLLQQTKKRTVREAFAQGVKICKAAKRHIERTSNSRAQPTTTLGSTLSTLAPTTQPSGQKSYNWIMEHLRERRNRTVRNVSVQCSRDFVSHTHRDVLASTGPMDSPSTSLLGHFGLSAYHEPTFSTNQRSPSTLSLMSDSEDYNSGGSELAILESDTVRKRLRRKSSSPLYPSCSCVLPGPNPSTNVCITCRKKKNHAQGSFSTVQSSSSPLFTKVTTMQNRQPERVIQCAAAVDGGEETVTVHNADVVHLLKSFVSYTRNLPSTTLPITSSHSSPCSFSSGDPTPPVAFDGLPSAYREDLLPPRVVVSPYPPFQRISAHPPSETARGSDAASQGCLLEKPTFEPQTQLENNESDFQTSSELSVASRFPTTSSGSHCDAAGSSTTVSRNSFSARVDDRCMPTNPSQVPSSSMSTSAADTSIQPGSSFLDGASSSDPVAERIFRKMLRNITPEEVKMIQSLTDEPPSKKRRS